MLVILQNLDKIKPNYNKDRVKNGFQHEKMVLGSMDIKKWYPSTIARPSAKVIYQMIVESKVDFDGIDFDAVSFYLGEHMTMEEILANKLEEIVYIKKENVNKQKKRKGGKGRALNTKACGGEDTNVTIACGEEKKRNTKL